MFKNLDMTMINKKRLMTSLWVPIPVVFLLMIIAGLILQSNEGKNFDFIVVLQGSIGMIIVGVIVWLPALIICLLIEYYAIRETTDEFKLGVIFAFEAFVPFLIYNLIIGEEEIVVLLTSFLIAYGAQAIRWIYLKRKGYMYN